MVAKGSVWGHLQGASHVFHSWFSNGKAMCNLYRQKLKLLKMRQASKECEHFGGFYVPVLQPGQVTKEEAESLFPCANVLWSTVGLFVYLFVCFKSGIGPKAVLAFTLGKFFHSALVLCSWSRVKNYMVFGLWINLGSSGFKK